MENENDNENESRSFDQTQRFASSDASAANQPTERFQMNQPYQPGQNQGQGQAQGQGQFPGQNPGQSQTRPYPAQGYQQYPGQGQYSGQRYFGQQYGSQPAQPIQPIQPPQPIQPAQVQGQPRFPQQQSPQFQQPAQPQRQPTQPRPVQAQPLADYPSQGQYQSAQSTQPAGFQSQTQAPARQGDQFAQSFQTGSQSQYRDSIPQLADTDYSNPYVNPAAGSSYTQAGSSSAKSAKKGLPAWIASAITALIVSLVVFGLGWLIVGGSLRSPQGGGSISGNGISSSTGGAGSSSNTIAGSSTWQTVAKRVAASVVSITVTSGNSEVMGSGVIIDKSGNVVTNNHVATTLNGTISITLSNGDIYEASIVGTDPTTDLAVLKIKNPPKNLTVASFADSSQLAVGENMMAIGNPLGFENTVTTGVVSALNRPVTLNEKSGSSQSSSSNTVYTNAVQIDASINSGNSGGPSFNASGKIIGINTAIASTGSSTTGSNSGSIGIGFAIPSNTVKWVTAELIQKGKVQHAQLGVTIQSGSSKLNGATRQGAVVRNVVSNSSASEAGIKSGDTIIAYNGNNVGSMESVLGYVRATKMNSKVTVTVIRDGQTKELSVTMNHAESSTTPGSQESQNSNDGSGSRDNQDNQDNQDNNDDDWPWNN